jgi:hypothetical protein
VRYVLTAMVILAAATPAYAQLTPNLLGGNDTKLKTDVEINAEKERESGYKSGISKIPDAKGKVDPWGNVRGAAPSPANTNQQRSGSKN